jgi:hypothetical protein
MTTPAHAPLPACRDLVLAAAVTHALLETRPAATIARYLGLDPAALQFAGVRTEYALATADPFAPTTPLAAAVDFDEDDEDDDYDEEDDDDFEDDEDDEFDDDEDEDDEFDDDDEDDDYFDNDEDDDDDD